MVRFNSLSMEHLLIVCTNRRIKSNAGNEKGVAYGMECGIGMRETTLLWCYKRNIISRDIQSPIDQCIVTPLLGNDIQFFFLSLLKISPKSIRQAQSWTNW